MNKKITSTDNRIYKLCASLAFKKYRDKEDMYLIEGSKLLEEAITKNAKIVAVIFREDISYNIVNVDTYEMPQKLFNNLSQTEMSQGILALIKKPRVTNEDLIVLNHPTKNIVVLDRLQDPGNIGTIIRTAAAAGYLAVISLKGTADVFSPKSIRAAAGSVFMIPIFFAEDNLEVIELARELGKKIVATCFDTEKYYYEEDLSEGIELIIGNEGNGISNELIEKADLKIKIPMQGNIESLNASVATGILMYEAIRVKK